MKMLMEDRRIMDTLSYQISPLNSVNIFLIVKKPVVTDSDAPPNISENAKRK
jgi:hypothetical protein